MIVLARPNTVLRAMAFAHTSHVGVIEEWMLWEGWRLFVGCDDCAGNGKAARCWGVKGCHGYSSGCGCRHCADRQARDVAEERAA